MSYFAQINSDNIVIQVISVEQEVLNTGIFGNPGMWIQTSYNTYAGKHYDPVTRQLSEDQSKALRKNFAGVGFYYDATRDAFIPPKPFSSWIVDEETCLWIPPVPCPTNETEYYWDEATISWIAKSAPDSI